MADFYITNYNRFPNPKLFRYYMFNEYNAIKLKKERQKINSIKFTFSQFKYDDIVIYSNYSVIYKNTSDNRYGKSIFERVIDSFKWQWDTPNVISLTIYLTIFFDLIRQSKKFVKKEMSRKSKDTLEEESAMLKYIYNMLFDFDKDFDTNLLTRVLPKLSDTLLGVTKSEDILNLLISF